MWECINCNTVNEDMNESCEYCGALENGTLPKEVEKQKNEMAERKGENILNKARNFGENLLQFAFSDFEKIKNIIKMNFDIDIEKVKGNFMVEHCIFYLLLIDRQIFAINRGMRDEIMEEIESTFLNKMMNLAEEEKMYYYLEGKLIEKQKSFSHISDIDQLIRLHIRKILEVVGAQYEAKMYLAIYPVLLGSAMSLSLDWAEI